MDSNSTSCHDRAKHARAHTNSGLPGICVCTESDTDIKRKRDIVWPLDAALWLPELVRPGCLLIPCLVLRCASCAPFLLSATLLAPWTANLASPMPALQTSNDPRSCRSSAPPSFEPPNSSPRISNRILSSHQPAAPPRTRHAVTSPSIDVRLPGKGDSNSHGARPVRHIITMIKWIRTSRLSIKNPPPPGMRRLTAPCAPDPNGSMAFLQKNFRCPPMLGARRT